jgi:ABC-2 type transport system permease protein
VADRLAVRQPSGITGGLLVDHALLLALGWPAVLTLVSVPLSVRALRRLGAWT